jgi:hypothetical protein
MIAASPAKLRPLCDKLHARFETKGGPVGDTFTYVGLSVIRNRKERSG